MNPFVGPLLAGWAVIAVMAGQIGAGRVYTALLLWGALWVVLEHVAPKGYPRSRVRLLTPNFFAVRDCSGCWRVFQRPPPRASDCQRVLLDLLKDQRRLPAALTPGRYRALTHSTILERLERMDNVSILSSSPAYVATLEDTISSTVGRQCHLCQERCPFRGRALPRQFYDVRWEIRKGANNGL